MYKYIVIKFIDKIKSRYFENPNFIIFKERLFNYYIKIIKLIKILIYKMKTYFIKI